MSDGRGMYVSGGGPFPSLREQGRGAGEVAREVGGGIAGGVGTVAGPQRAKAALRRLAL